MQEVRARYEALFPRLHPHQSVLIVPGVFGCDVHHDSKAMCPWNHGAWNTSRRLAAQSETLVAKLQAYWRWVLTEPRVAGFNPYHYDNEPCNLGEAACMKIFEAHSDTQLGAASFPDVVQQLKIMGEYIIKHGGPSNLKLKADDEDTWVCAEQNVFGANLSVTCAEGQSCCGQGDKSATGLRCYWPHNVLRWARGRGQYPNGVQR